MLLNNAALDEPAEDYYAGSFNSAAILSSMVLVKQIFAPSGAACCELSLFKGGSGYVQGANMFLYTLRINTSNLDQAQPNQNQSTLGSSNHGGGCSAGLDLNKRCSIVTLELSADFACWIPWLQEQGGYNGYSFYDYTNSEHCSSKDKNLTIHTRFAWTIGDSSVKISSKSIRYDPINDIQTNLTDIFETFGPDVAAMFILSQMGLHVGLATGTFFSFGSMKTLKALDQ